MTAELIDDRLRLVPNDPDAVRRSARLRALGLEGLERDAEFDAFAAKLAHTTTATSAMVNIFVHGEQCFFGLWTTRDSEGSVWAAAHVSVPPGPARTMPRDEGFCPHVVERGLALVLDDVCSYPRFAGNKVVDKLGVRSYLGAPLIDRTGVILGTVCVVDDEPRPWGRPGLDMIKRERDNLMKVINRREP